MDISMCIFCRSLIRKTSEDPKWTHYYGGNERCRPHDRYSPVGHPGFDERRGIVPGYGIGHE